jgi:hypothetical protein
MLLLEVVLVIEFACRGIEGYRSPRVTSRDSRFVDLVFDVNWILYVTGKDTNMMSLLMMSLSSRSCGLEKFLRCQDQP